MQNQPVSAELLLPTSQSIVLNLDITATEVDLILEEISSWNPLPPGLPALSIYQTPINEASRNKQVFSIAFPILYSTGQADFNTL
jgi:hypothetical protein